MSEEKVYRLYAMAASHKNIEHAMQARFSRVTPGYVMIYTDGEAPENSVEITGEDVKRLTKDDEAWLMSCAGRLLMDRLEAEGRHASENLNSMIDRLATALKEERRKLGMEEGEASDGNTDRGTAESTV